ncbi:MAG: 23S rRNA (pseudouridine(1915)-N(3))-methyltransferase RlmH [Chlorobi bacterium]|nr:23S rRNA (pseudouridine(1915)-N(3))-methyltransferase RlmH [Chlorobiota bacterium]
MKIKWVVTGKTGDECTRRLTDEWLLRVQRWIKIEYVEIEVPKSWKNLSPELRKQKEAALQLKYVAPRDYLVLLDEKGKEFTSRQWARRLEELSLRTPGFLVFLTGGPYGFAPEVYGRAQELLALSRMTFSHQVIRIMFAEQLYRAVAILKGYPYHND